MQNYNIFIQSYIAYNAYLEPIAHGDYIYFIKLQPLQVCRYTDLRKDRQPLKRENIICCLTYQYFTLWPKRPNYQSANVVLILLNDKPQYIVYGYGL